MLTINDADFDLNVIIMYMTICKELKKEKLTFYLLLEEEPDTT